MGSELRAYGRSLPEGERIVFEQLLKAPFRRVGCISAASSIHLWAFLLLSVMVEQERRLRAVEVACGCVEAQRKNSALAENP